MSNFIAPPIRICEKTADRAPQPANGPGGSQPLSKQAAKSELHWIPRIRRSFERRKKKIADFGDCLTVTNQEDVEQLMQRVQTKYTSTLIAQANHDARHKIQGHIVKTMNWISDFMGSYAGVCEIARSAAGAKAEIPYVAISVLFIVSIHMQKIHDLIQETLTDVKEEFPGIVEITSLMDNAQLYEIFERLSQNIDLLSETAAWYYRRTWIGQVWYTFWHPPMRYLGPVQHQIEKDIWKIERRVLSYLAMQAKKNEERNQARDEWEQARDQRAKIKEQRDVSDKQRYALMEIQRELGICGQEKESESLQLYKAILLRIQAESGQPEVDLQKVLERTRYRTWRETTKSIMLILYADPAYLENHKFFWLSLTAVYEKEIVARTIIEKEKDNSTRGSLDDEISAQEGVHDGRQNHEGWKCKQPILLHYFFSTHEDAAKGCEAHTMICHLISQLMSAVPDLTLNLECREQLQELINKNDWTDKDPVRPCKYLGELLGRVPDHEVFIVLDRIDLCSCAVQLLVRRLERILRDVNTVVRIFAILGPLQGLHRPGNDVVFFDKVDIVDITKSW